LERGGIMSLRVWLDDIRPLPPGYNVHVTTAEDAINLLKTGKVELISLDHDLGTEATGYDVAVFIEEAAYFKTLQPFEVRIHTANIVGEFKMQKAIANAYKAWAA
jgi:hypothetical protein